MPRPHRAVPGGYVYHVLNRATDKRTIFESANDYAAFYGLLLAAVRRIPMRVCAYCLMPNHWHLVLWPTADNAISAYIHWLCTSHALQFHRGLGAQRPGHVYQGPYRCFPVQSEQYYYNVIRYVESNAQRAGLVTLAEDWPWSSASERLLGQRLIEPGPLPLPADWLDVLRGGLAGPVLQELQTCTRRDRPYGSSEWTQRTAAALGLAQKLRPRGRPRRPDARDLFVKMRLT